jgi:hypothetical protein
MGTKIKFATGHNVFKIALDGEENLARHDPSKLFVNAHTQLLIDKLLLHRPTWEFWATDYPSGDGTSSFVHSRFDIMSDGERLGWIGTDRHWRSGESRYEFDCDRLKLKRQKSSTPHTKDLNKAAKAILGSMYNQTPAERSAIARGTVMSAVSRRVQGAEHGYRMPREALTPHMVEFVAAHWEEFSAIPMDKQLDGARAVLLEKREALKDAITISEPFAANTGAVLIDTGSAYIVSKAGDQSTARTLRLEEMSDKLKGSLGILKLLDPKHYAPGIGIRADETTYYVVDADE